MPKWTGRLCLHLLFVYDFFNSLKLAIHITPKSLLGFALLISGHWNTSYNGTSIRSICKKQSSYLGFEFFSLYELYQLNKLLGKYKELFFSLVYNNITVKLSSEQDLSMVHIDSTKAKRYCKNPDGLSQVGFLKNNTTGVCVGMNSTNFNNGFPLTSVPYNGNINDQQLLQPTVKTITSIIADNKDNNKLLISIDKGYGAISNLFSIIASGYNYIVSLKFKGRKDNTFDSTLNHFITNYVNDDINAFKCEQLVEDLPVLPYKVRLSEDLRTAFLYVVRKIDNFDNLKLTEELPEQDVKQLMNNGYNECVEIVVDLNKRNKDLVKHYQYIEQFTKLSESQQISKVLNSEQLRRLEVELKENEVSQENEPSQETAKSQSKNKLSTRQTLKKVVRVITAEEKIKKMILYAGVRMYATSNLELANGVTTISKTYARLQYRTENGHKQAHNFGMAPLHLHTDEGLEGKNVINFLLRCMMSFIEIAYNVTSRTMNTFLNDVCAMVKDGNLLLMFNKESAKIAKELGLNELNNSFPLNQRSYIGQNLFNPDLIQRQNY